MDIYNNMDILICMTHKLIIYNKVYICSGKGTDASGLKVEENKFSKAKQAQT